VEYGAFAPLSVDGLDQLAAESVALLDGEEVSLDQLAGLGDSSGGAGPKILVGLREADQHMCADAEVLPKGYLPYIVKFRSSSDREDAAEVEYAYSLMASQAGLHMARTRLLHGTSGKAYFATRRFDRQAGRRVHMVSAAGLLHDNFRLPAIDYGHLMDASRQLTGSRQEMLKVFRLAAFNVFTANLDDHSKNFAFLADELGAWRFAPAYDLTFARSAHGEHSTTVGGTGRDPGVADLLALGKTFDLSEASSVIEEVRTAVLRWPEFAAEAGVRADSSDEIRGVIKRACG